MGTEKHFSLALARFKNFTKFSQNSRKMGLFGSSGVDSSGSSSDTFGSKLRTPSYSTESDFGSESSSFGADGGALNSMNLAGGDFEKGLQIEQQKATLMTQIHNMTDVCWETCIGTSSISSSLGRKNEDCLSNCAARFVDSTLFITNRFAQLASKQK